MLIKKVLCQRMPDCELFRRYDHFNVSGTVRYYTLSGFMSYLHAHSHFSQKLLARNSLLRHVELGIHDSGSRSKCSQCNITENLSYLVLSNEN
jgi:hypothetical protein